MGYVYTSNGSLVCDCCDATTAKKRTCTHRVGALPYCSPPALCDDCYQQQGGPRLHDRCKKPAALARARDLVRRLMLEAGHFERCTAWGDWHESVPTGKVGVRFVGAGGQEEYRLLPEDSYNSHDWLHEFGAAEPWDNPPTQGKQS
jgi:hypothetical protein